MRQNSVHGERTPYGGPQAGDLGWDDSLYERHVPGQHDNSGYPYQGPGDLGDGGGYGGDDGPKPRKRRVLRWFVLFLAVLIVGTAGAGYLYYQHLNGNLIKDHLNLGDSTLDKSEANAEGQRPLNILLLGSDSRNSARNLALGGAKDNVGREPLADVQMLLHVSADRSNMSVISIPRDTRVSTPKCTDPDDGKVYPATDALTINKSLQHGGPGCTVATWEKLTRIPIDHFMMIDFAGVVSMADAVGGVPVCVNNNVYDSSSKLRLEKGTTTVKGERALQWLRTRHGFEDGSDIGRAKAQHMYMGAMVRELKAGTKLTDPNKLRKLAEAATKALTVDQSLGSIKKLNDLANDIKRVPTRRTTMATMPWVPDAHNPAHVIPKPGEAEQIFSLVRKDTALDGKDKKKAKPSVEPVEPTVPLSEIPVAVRNGTGTVNQAPITGRAAVIREELVRLGFSQSTADATPASQTATTIRYPDQAQRGNALAVAKSLGVPHRSVQMSSAVTQVTVVVGADWRDGNAYPKQAPEDKAPASAGALNGNDRSACMKVNPANVW